MEFLLFFVIPVKAKWLGMLDGVLFAWDIFRSVKNGILISPSYFATAVCALMAVMNFIIFFAMTRNMKKYSYKEVHRKKVYRQEVTVRHPARGTSAPSADGQRRTATIWNSVTAPNATAITSTARIICSHTSI